MYWITRSATEVLNIAANQRAAGLISVIAGVLARGDSIHGLKDITGVLSGLEGNDAVRQQLLDLFARQAVDILGGVLPSNALDELSRLLSSQEMHQRLPDLRLLVCGWDQVGTVSCPGIEPRIHWYGLDRFASSGDAASAPLAEIQFELGADAERALIFEAIDSSQVPEAFGSAVRSTLQRGLRVTLTGKAGARADVEIPIRFGAFAIGTNARASARLDFFVDRGSDALVATSFAAAFRALANPFDLDAVERVFGERRLRAVRIEAGGSVGLNGSLTVGVRDKLFSAAGGLDTSLGLELGFHTARSGDYLANLYPAFPLDATRREVRLDIHRLRSREDSTSLGLGLTLDLTPVLNELGDDLVERADDAKELLRRFDDFIPPSAAIREEVDDWLEENVTLEQRALLGTVLGSSGEASATQRLSQRLAEALDRQTSVWRDQAGRLADQVAADVIARLPIAAIEQQAIRQIAAMAVEMGLEHAQGELRERIEKELTDDEENALLQRAFAMANESIEPGLDRLDEIAGRIGNHLDRLQGTIANLAKALRESSEIKLRARWHSQETRTRSTSVEQSLLFRPGIAGAADLFREAMTGSLEDLFHKLRESGEDDTREPVSLISGSLQDYAGVRRESGLELALLDFDLADSHIMDAGVTIETDAAGNISVRSESRSRGRRSGLRRYTEYEVVNSFELATARQTRRMNLSLALSHVEHDLQPAEARDFFSGFAKPDFGLLTRLQISNAIDAMPGREQRRRGELRAWLELDSNALKRLLRLPPHATDMPASRVLSPREEREVFHAAVDALVAGLQFSGARAKWNNLTDHIERKLGRKDMAIILKETYDGRHIPALKPSSFIDPVDGPGFRTVEEIVERARSLVQVVDRMRAIYLSDGRLSVDEYLDRQEKVGDAISGWYKGEFLAAGAEGLMSSKAGPFALAFFKAIADLSTDESGHTPRLMAGIVVEHNGVEHEIPLLVDEPAGAIEPMPAPPLPSRLLNTVPVRGSSNHRPSPAAGSTPEPTPQPPSGGTSGLGPTPPSPHRPPNEPMEQPPFIYPLDDKPGTRTYHADGRQFDARRRNTSRRHAGCDMLAPKGTAIRAMADGVVRRGPSEFYSGTYALEVIHDRLTGDLAGKSMIVRYGEIQQRVSNGVGEGKRVRQGDVIASVGRLNSGSSMLHLEMYSDGAHGGSLTVPGSGKYHRRSDVTDPTPFLKKAPSWAEVQAGRAPDAPREPQAPPATTGPQDTVPPGRVPSALNCRKQPRIDAAVPPLYQLRPGELFHVMRLVTGGPHPFDSRNLWAEIGMPGREPGYVVAHFVEMKDPARLSMHIGNLPPQKDDRGVVKIDGDTLNLRDSPGMQGGIKAKLERGDHVTIVRDDFTAPTDQPTRNTWYEVVTEDGQRGYVAAHYVALEAAQPPDPSPDRPAELGVYTKTLIETDWPGCKEKTAGQINSPVGGPDVSRRMAEEDLERVIGMASVFQDAMGKFGVPAAILAGIASRESRCGNFLRGGWSVNGEDFGVMQINKHAHPGLSTHDPRGVDHIMEATDILADFMRRIFDEDSKWHRQGWEPRYLLQGAVAAYNFGLDDVRTRERIDIGTTNDDYADDALARAAYYYQHQRLKTFFQ